MKALSRTLILLTTTLSLGQQPAWAEEMSGFNEALTDDAQAGTSAPTEEAEPERFPRGEFVYTFLDRNYSRGGMIPVRAELGIGGFYADRALETVSLDFYAYENTSLVLLLDGRRGSRPQYAYAGEHGRYTFFLPARRNYLGRNFRSVQIFIDGSGYAGELTAELGGYYAGDRPLPPGPGPIRPIPHE